MKKFLSIIISIVLILSICPIGLFSITASAISGNTTEFAGGSGTEDEPYLILTKIHLNNIRKYPDSCFKQIGNIYFDDEDFERNGDFYNFGYGWKSFDFKGKYDGNSYTINNLQGEDGFFKKIENAELKNIVLNVNFNIEKDLNYSQTNFGCLAYVAYNSIVQGCHVSGILNIDLIDAGSWRDDSNVGGIFASAFFSEILNSSSAVSINGTLSGEGDLNIAGICCWVGSETIVKNCQNTGNLCNYAGGDIAGIAWYNSGGKIENCKNEGEIGEPSDWWPAWSSAGICVSNNNGEIINCENYGKISSYYEAGGIVALSGGIVKECVNYGECNSKDETASGIVAQVSNFNECQISECINYGKILAYGQAGGIVGRAFEGATVTDCTNYGDINSTKSLSGGYGAGGIVGQLSSGTITKSRNFGGISSSNAAGGICGNNSSVINECYNSGSITLSDNGTNAGGIAGDNYGTIKNCYNIAKINTQNTKDVNLGGIAGLTSSDISNCYNISDVDAFGNFGGICGKNNSNENVLNNCVFLSFEGLYAVGKGYGDALSAKEEVLQSIETYKDFDFNNIWTMDGNTDYPYPELRNVEMIYVPYVLGDLDGNDDVTDRDAVYLLYHTFLPDIYPVNQDCDFNNDGSVNDKDAVYLLYYTFLPDLYPIN